MTFHHRSHAHTYTLTGVVSAAAVEWKKTVVHRTPPPWDVWSSPTVSAAVCVAIGP